MGRAARAEDEEEEPGSGGVQNTSGPEAAAPEDTRSFPTVSTPEGLSVTDAETEDETGGGAGFVSVITTLDPEDVSGGESESPLEEGMLITALALAAGCSVENGEDGSEKERLLGVLTWEKEACSPALLTAGAADALGCGGDIELADDRRPAALPPEEGGPASGGNERASPLSGRPEDVASAE